MLPTALFITFLVVPSVSLRLRAFRCECENGESYLRADYSLQCTTGGSCLDTDARERYDDPRVRRCHFGCLGGDLASPSGACLYAVLLLAAQASRPGADAASAALSFLHEDYNVPLLVGAAVVGRKLMVVGFATLIFPGTLMQLVVVLLCAYMLVLVKSRPYTRKSVTTLAEVEQFSLCVVVALCVLIKVEQLASQLDRYLTAELRTRFVFDSDVVSDMMLTALLATASVASFFPSAASPPPRAARFDATLAAKRDPAAEAEEEEVDDGAAAAAARAKAAAHLRAVLDTPTSSLEVPAIQYARDAAINPMMGQRMAEAKVETERERRQRRAPRARECARRRERARRGHAAAGQRSSDPGSGDAEAHDGSPPRHPSLPQLELRGPCGGGERRGTHARGPPLPQAR